jgi:hypothetical protein
MVRVFWVDFDSAAAIRRVIGDLGVLGAAFGDEMAGGLGDELGCVDEGVVGDRLVDSVVSMFHVCYLQADLEFPLSL